RLPVSCDYFPCNIASASDRTAAVRYVCKTYGRLDLLVNNAGVAPLKRQDILEMTEESFDRVIGINLKGTLFMCQTAAKEMLQQIQAGLPDYHPRIVNIGSMSAYTSSISRGEYCISKAGIGMVTKLFADRLSREGIPVFEIRPGIIDTDMTKVVHEKYDRLIAEGLLPVPRFGQPEDVAKMVLACASGLLDYSAGQVLDADGGFSLRRL
ncbi:MAG: 3-ketoacyl-ACP reductase, partial [Clostridia bacterium]|nr:3-ketoacyl-ACP reductase [Clostridia bacterium]